MSIRRDEATGYEILTSEDGREWIERRSHASLKRASEVISDDFDKHRRHHWTMRHLLIHAASAETDMSRDALAVYVQTLTHMDNDFHRPLTMSEDGWDVPADRLEPAMDDLRNASLLRAVYRQPDDDPRGWWTVWMNMAGR